MEEDREVLYLKVFSSLLMLWMSPPVLIDRIFKKLTCGGVVFVVSLVMLGWSLPALSRDEN